MGCAAGVPVSHGMTNIGIDDISSKNDGKSKILIYFGSQTGTAEGFARTMAKEAIEQGYSSHVVNLEDFRPEVLHSAHLAMFIVATTGDGEPTDNAVRFHKWLTEDKTIPPKYLYKTRYCVFGLGNRTYDNFARMGKQTDAGLASHGATRICPLSEADDNGSTEDDFDEWRSTIWIKIKNSLSAPPAVSVAEPSVTVIPSNNNNNGPSDEEHASCLEKLYSARLVKIITNKELCSTPSSSSSDGRGLKGPSVRHIELDLTGTNITYNTADNIMLLPENSNVVVNSIALSQGYDLDGTYVPFSGDVHPFKPPLRVKTILSKFLDLSGLISHSQMKKILPFLKDDNQKAWLLNILHETNKSQFKSYVEDDGKSLADILTHELNSAKIPLADLIHIANYMQPRYYTISSSSSVHPSVVHITISITQFALKSGRMFIGLASQYLSRASIGSNCRIVVRPSSFRLPPQLSSPIICIAGGSGLAPMRALLQDREYQMNNRSDNKAVNVLFFGCKNKSVDYIYRDELEAYESKGVLTELHTAFSRDGPTKVYVQGLMAESSVADKLISLLFSEGAYVYVCGATAMGTDVMTTMHNILIKHKGMSAAEATDFLKSLQSSNRYVQELWSVA